VKKLLLILIALLLVWGLFFRESDAPTVLPGLRVASVPEQTATDKKPWMVGEAKIVPLAAYSLSARVLSRKRYFFDATAKIAPLDLALGWGDMSDAAVIKTLQISQGSRWYEYFYDENCPITPGAIGIQSANVHCLPADSFVEESLLSLRKNSFVSLRGYLVEVQFAGQPSWRSSLTRDDTGTGACEIFWITNVNEFYPQSL